MKTHRVCWMCLMTWLLGVAPVAWAVQDESTYTSQTELKVPMSDGVNLMVDILLPKDGTKFSAVLVRSPYGRAQFASFLGKKLVKEGFAVVLQDVRGMGDSEGRFIPFIHEKQDGLDTLSWITQQAWSNGKIGMWGASYLGFCALVLAPENPPGLSAIVNFSGWGDTQEMTSPGGAIHFQIGLPWTLSGQIRGRSSGGPIDWPTAFRHVPVTEIPASIGIQTPVWENTVDLFTNGTLKETASMIARGKEITVPTLHVTGWYDFVARHTLDAYEAIEGKRGRSKGAPQKLLVGPWRHDQQWGDDTKVGDEDFGPQCILGSEKAVALSARWFDRWLNGNENGIMKEKPAKLFVMGPNEWREYDQWPPRRVEYQNWYFDSNGGANTSSGDGRLAAKAPAKNGADRFVFDPMDPVPTTGGVNCHFFLETLGVRDQRSVEERKDVLVYTSAPMEKDLDIIGPLKAVVYASTEGRTTDITAKLVEVRPDGYAKPIEDGIKRGCDPVDGAAVTAMEPGKAYRFTIDMGATGISIKKGNRLRVEISSSNFPKYTRNPNTGEMPERATEFSKVTQTVLHSAEYPSHIVLPVLK